MQAQSVRVSVKGKDIHIPAIDIDGILICVNGTLVKVASIYGEQWLHSNIDINIDTLLNKIKLTQLSADIFTFSQKIPNVTPSYNYHMEWDNYAVIHLHSYDNWWKHQITQVTRKNVRRAIKRGVTTRIVAFDNAFIAGIVDIYNETPIRQGRRFWHYGKDIAVARRENSSYLDRSEFIGAYYGDELIGFLKLVYMDKVAAIMQILSKNSHFDRRPANALIAKAVECCEHKNVSYFVYGNYIYEGNTQSPLIEFKRRNGFEPILVPRYYIPLTSVGRMTLRLRMHHGVRAMVPQKVQQIFLNLRSRWYEHNASFHS